MTNNSATYSGFPTRRMLILSLVLTCLIYPLVRWRQIDTTGAERSGLLLFSGLFLFYLLFALTFSWLANRAQLQRNLQDQSFFLIVGYLLTRLISTAIALLTVLIFARPVPPDGLLSKIMLNGLANFALPNPQLLVQLLIGLCLLPPGRREPFGYPSFAWLLLPVAVLPPLLFLLFSGDGGALTLALTITAAIAGAVAVLGLRWLVESFLFFRRLEHILLFLPLGLLLGYFLEWLVFMGGVRVIGPLFNVPASQFAKVLGSSLAAFNLPGLLLGLLLGCYLLPRLPGR